MFRKIVINQAIIYGNYYKIFEFGDKFSTLGVSVRVPEFIGQLISTADAAANGYMKKLNPDEYFSHIYLDDISGAFDSVGKLLEREFIKQRDDVVKEVGKRIEEVEASLNKQESTERQGESFIEECEVEIAEHRAHLADIEIQQKECEEIINLDRQTLKMYMNYVRKAFLAQRKELIAEINSEITAEERMMNILLLGIIEEDYKKISEVNVIE